MTYEVNTIKGKQKLTQARAGIIALPAISKMVFGNGAVDGNNNILNPMETDETLRNELLRKDIESRTFPTRNVCRYSCVISADELNSAVINEVGLIDEEGDLICIKTFPNKPKFAGEPLIIQIDDIF